MRNKKTALVVQSIDKVSDWSGKIIAFLLVGMVGVLLIEVVARYVFGHPTKWAHVSAQLMFAVYAIMLGAYALVHRSHVNMDIFYNRLSERARAVLDLCTSTLFFFWCGILLWFGGEFAAKSIALWQHSSTVWNPPIWEVKLAIAVGAFLIVLQGLAKFIRDLSIAVTGDKLE